MAHDYSGFSEQATDQDLSQVSDLAALAFEQQAAVDAAEAALKSAKQALTQTIERDLPEAMERCGMRDFTTAAGLSVKIKDTIRASIPVARRSEAHAWLVKHGHGGIVKESVTVGFGVQEREEAQALLGRLRERYANVKSATKVEPSTLRAFIKEQLAEGADIPMSMFGAHEQRKAMVKATAT